MKFLVSELSYLWSNREARRNLGALAKFLLVLVVVIAVFTIAFHWIMESVEGRHYSWITGLYWTLTVMSTLGFGDITFESDAGRAFSVLVLVAGIVLLLIMLPFAFIRYAYAPWLEAQLHNTAPRELPEETRGHVIICAFETLAEGLIERLKALGIPYWVLEADAAKAAALHARGIHVVAGDFESRETYAAVRVAQAQMVFANLEDRINTNIVLTVREESGDVPIVAIVKHQEAIDILELSGATHVLPLTHRLGEQLASRVTAREPHVHVIGHYGDIALGEFPIAGTELAGRSVRESRIRERTGISVVGLWERGKLHQARADRFMAPHMVAVVVGPRDKMDALDELFVEAPDDEAPVVVIGGGVVGRAAARALKKRQVPVHIVDHDDALRVRLEEIADLVVIGDAADRDIVGAVGVENAASIILTTNDDATNIYLAAYCRRLSPKARIISRITHERNLEAVHRAGADFALSYGTLGAQSVMSILQHRELLMLAEGVEVIIEPCPIGLAGVTLADGRIAARTGLTVVGIRTDEGTESSLTGNTEVPDGSELIMFGTPDQRTTFRKVFSKRSD